MPCVTQATLAAAIVTSCNVAYASVHLVLLEQPFNALGQATDCLVLLVHHFLDIYLHVVNQHAMAREAVLSLMVHMAGMQQGLHADWGS
jgi:hypothetical protein